MPSEPAGSISPGPPAPTTSRSPATTSITSGSSQHRPRRLDLLHLRRRRPARPRSAIPTRSPRPTASTPPAASPTSPTRSRGAALAAYGYTFNAEGQRLTESSPEGTTTYAYDNLGRLTSAAYPAQQVRRLCLRRRRQSHEPGPQRRYHDLRLRRREPDHRARPPAASPRPSPTTPTATGRASRSRPRPTRRAPSVPGNLAATAISATEVDLAWSASSDNVAVTSYRIYRDATLIATVSGSATSFADVTTTGSTTYAYTVAAVDGSGNASNQSTAANATTPSGTPGTDTTAPSVPDRSLRVRRRRRPDRSRLDRSTDDVAVAGYDVYRDGTKITTVPVGSTSFTDTGVGRGRQPHLHGQRHRRRGQRERAELRLDRRGNLRHALDHLRLRRREPPDRPLDRRHLDRHLRLRRRRRSSRQDDRGGHDRLHPRSRERAAAGARRDHRLAHDRLRLRGLAPRDRPIGGDVLVSDRHPRLGPDAHRRVGQSASSYNYSAFGATRTSSGSVANEVRFSGERTDTESGLEFLRARTYDPSTGTFLSRDTWGITPTDGQSLGLYLYTENDPIDRVDPSGHCWGICISFSPPSLPIPDLSAAAHVALGAATLVPGHRHRRSRRRCRSLRLRGRLRQCRALARIGGPWCRSGLGRGEGFQGDRQGRQRRQ